MKTVHMALSICLIWISSRLSASRCCFQTEHWELIKFKLEVLCITNSNFSSILFKHYLYFFLIYEHNGCSCRNLHRLT